MLALPEILAMCVFQVRRSVLLLGRGNAVPLQEYCCL